MNTNVSNLQVGSRVEFQGFYGVPGDHGTIVSMTGQPHYRKPRTVMGGMIQVIEDGDRDCSMTVVLDDGRRHRGLTVSSFHGLRPWLILDEPVRTDAEVSDALALADRVDAENERAAEAERDRKARLREQLLMENAQLVLAKDDRNALQKNLRKLLKNELPGLSFSVRKDSGAIDVSCKTKLTGDQRTVAKEICDRFKYGSFDGMTDSYDYDSSKVWPDLFGGARFVFLHA